MICVCFQTCKNLQVWSFNQKRKFYGFDIFSNSYNRNCCELFQPASGKPQDKKKSLSFCPAVLWSQLIISWNMLCITPRKSSFTDKTIKNLICVEFFNSNRHLYLKLAVVVSKRRLGVCACVGMASGIKKGHTPEDTAFFFSNLQIYSYIVSSCITDLFISCIASKFSSLASNRSNLVKMSWSASTSIPIFRAMAISSDDFMRRLHCYGLYELIQKTGDVLEKCFQRING